jgi:hypothetical protein
MVQSDPQSDKEVIQLMRVVCFAVLCLLLALPGWAGILYDNGPVNGFDTSLYIDGPGPGPYTQTISDEFVATGTGTADSLDFGIWVTGGSTPTTVSWAIGTSWFSSDISSGFEVQVGYTFVNNNSSWDVYRAHVDGLSGALAAGNTYYLTLGDGNDSFADQLVLWDVNGGPAACYWAATGVPQGGCGYGGEAFTIYSAGAPGIPEPASLVLFGSGLLLLGGLLRRRLG